MSPDTRKEDEGLLRQVKTEFAAIVGDPGSRQVLLETNKRDEAIKASASLSLAVWNRQGIRWWRCFRRAK